ncbi:MAG TPA: family 16 glycosylhydrolase [Phycisphaerae bacterium]|nr:family 16 glycosylhydrolase [Phycisphaerae bacterium]
MNSSHRQLEFVRRHATSQRRIAIALSLACVLGCASTLHAQLTNAGFEAGDFGGWQTFGANLAVAPITPHNGTFSAAITGENNGSANYSGFFQNVTSKAGVTWTASAWARHNTNTALTGTDNYCDLKIEFYQVANGVYGTSDLISEFSTSMVHANTPTNTWVEHTLQAVAPTGTVEVRIAVVFTQLNDDPGAVIIDDAHLQSDNPPNTGWDVFWADEFDGTEVDTSKWRVEDIHQVKNNELQYYAPDDVFLTTVGTRDVLDLRSQQRTISGFDNQGNFGTWNYTSGLVDTRDRFAMVYGRFEVGAKLPATKGMWPAHWGLASDGGWPPEIDIMEQIGQVPNVTHMSLHWGPLGPNGEPPWEIGRTVTGTYTGPDFTADFHEYAVEWFPDRLDWYVDGVIRQTTSNPNIPKVPFFWILNTAVGGDWPGPPDGTTVFPQHHYIDYVRAYVPSDPGPASLELADDSRTNLSVDGVISPGEYTLSAAGLNNGAGDILGANSSLYFDSDSAGNLVFAFDNASAWPAGLVQGVVVYVDSVSDGSVSTYELTDESDPSRRLISGKSSTGQRGDLFFPLGFRADYAICLFSSLAGVYHVDNNELEFVQGAFLNAGTDVLGGDEVSYQGNSDQRELRIRLSHLGAQPRDAIRLLANVFNTSNGIRYNEFVGATAGNPWDAANTPAGKSTVMKPGDFIRLQTAPGFHDADADGDVDDADFAILAECFAGPLNAPPSGGSLSPAECLAVFDVESDGHMDLRDFKEFQLRFGEGITGSN